MPNFSGFDKVSAQSRDYAIEFRTLAELRWMWEKSELHGRLITTGTPNVSWHELSTCELHVNHM